MPVFTTDKVAQSTSNLPRIAHLVGPPPLKDELSVALMSSLFKSRAAGLESSAVPPVPPPPMNSQTHSQRLTISRASVYPPPLSRRPSLTIHEVRQFLRQLSAADNRTATVKKSRRASILTLVLGRAQSPALA